MDRILLEKHIFEEYGVKSEYPWMRYPGYAVFRHNAGKKWFAVVMNLPRGKFVSGAQGNADFMNVKCDSILIESLLREPGIYPAYHMNKNHWVSVCLDGDDAPDDFKIKWLLEMSFALTGNKV